MNHHGDVRSATIELFLAINTNFHLLVNVLFVGIDG